MFVMGGSLVMDFSNTSFCDTSGCCGCNTSSNDRNCCDFIVIIIVAVILIFLFCNCKNSCN